MRKIQRISDSEMEVMKIIWEKGAPITTAEIHEKLPEGKNWAASTVLTFLARLVNKGIITTKKNCVANIITANLTEKEYLAIETQKFLNHVHKGSPKSFFAALIDSEELSRDDIEDLKGWFSEL